MLCGVDIRGRRVESRVQRVQKSQLFV